MILIRRMILLWYYYDIIAGTKCYFRVFRIFESNLIFLPYLCTAKCVRSWVMLSSLQLMWNINRHRMHVDTLYYIIIIKALNTSLMRHQKNNKYRLADDGPFKSWTRLGFRNLLEEECKTVLILTYIWTHFA